LGLRGYGERRRVTIDDGCANLKRALGAKDRPAYLLGPRNPQLFNTPYHIFKNGGFPQFSLPLLLPKMEREPLLQAQGHRGRESGPRLD